MQRIAELVQQVVNMPGTSIENNGQVILAGTIPGTKPVQYRYEFFKPLTDEEIKSVSDSSRRPFPKQLAQLYKITNGANLFGRFIRINGIPAWGADYKQPCSLIFEDGHRTVLCPKSRLFFASYYTQPQIQVFFDTKEPEDAMRVYAARYGSNKIIAEAISRRVAGQRTSKILGQTSKWRLSISRCSRGGPHRHYVQCRLSNRSIDWRLFHECHFSFNRVAVSCGSNDN